MLLTFGLWAACTDKSFSGMTDEGDGDVDLKIPVMVAVSNVDGGLTKGSGIVENLSGFVGKPLYVHAVRSEDGVSYRDAQSVLLDNRQATLSKEDFYLRWSDGGVRYYPNQARFKERYDFFAYYLDDAVKAGRSTADETAKLRISVDGTQDIMVARGDNSTPSTKLRSYMFSYYTARENVIPVFHFKHCMTCLDFKIQNGVSGEYNYRITVQGIKFYTHTALDLTYAAKDSLNLGVSPCSDADRVLVSLKGEGGTEFPRDHYVLQTRSSASQKQTVIPIGGNMLVHPSMEASSTVVLAVDEIRLDESGKPVGSTNSSNVTVTIYHPNGLKAGSRYTVSLTLSGNMSVSASVAMTPWTDAGNIDLGEEDKPKI